MSWRAQIRGAENLAPEMLNAFNVGVERGLEMLGAKGAEMVVENIKTPYGEKPAAVAFGNLAGSIVSNFVREVSMCREIIGVGTSLGADVYAAPVETGARPHMPPPDALVPWVIKKFGFAFGPLKQADDKAVRSLAFVIAKKIAQRGTQGHLMFERALEELEPQSPGILEAALAQALRESGFTGVSA